MKLPNFILMLPILFLSLFCRAAFAADQIPTLEHLNHSFSKVPESTDKSLSKNQIDSMPKNWECPSADVFSFSSGPQLAICGSLEPIASPNRAYLINSKGEIFWIVVRNTDGSRRALVAGGGWGENPALLEPQGTTHFLYVEAIKGPSTYYSLFKIPIVCDDTTCSVGQKICGIDVPKDIYPDVIPRIYAEKHKKFSSLPNSEAYLNLATKYSHELLLQALAGDRISAAVLKEFPFELDGAVGELVGADQDTYKRAKDFGCRGL